MALHGSANRAARQTGDSSRYALPQRVMEPALSGAEGSEGSRRSPSVRVAHVASCSRGIPLRLCVYSLGTARAARLRITGIHARIRKLSHFLPYRSYRAFVVRGVILRRMPASGG